MTSNNIGLILAFATAITVVLKDRTINKLGKSNFSDLTTNWAMFCASIPIQFLFAAIIFTLYPVVPQLTSQFWIALVINLPLLILANYFYIKAYRGDDLYSAIAPLTALTPVGTILTAYIFIRKVPTFWGVVAVLVCGIGFYCLGLSRIKPGIKWSILTPLKMLYSTREARYMLIVTIVWMFTSAIDAMGIYGVTADEKVVQAMTWSLIKTSFATIIMFGMCLYAGQPVLNFREVFSRRVLLLGFFYALEHIFHMTAVAMWNVVYVIAIKRTSIVIAVIVGIICDKEKNRLFIKISGAVIIVAAVILIMFKG